MTLIQWCLGGPVIQFCLLDVRPLAEQLLLTRTLPSIRHPLQRRPSLIRKGLLFLCCAELLERVLGGVFAEKTGDLVEVSFEEVSGLKAGDDVGFNGIDRSQPRK